MNRIPTEGLKLLYLSRAFVPPGCLNEQNPDRGIETVSSVEQCPALIELE